MYFLKYSFFKTFQLTTLSQGLRAEKASRSDLETYVAVLNTQKAVMQADMDKIKLDLQEGEYKKYFCTLYKTMIFFVLLASSLLLFQLLLF